jgi:hypothetical protein
MANEGIMALPQGMGMQGEQAQQQRPTVTSADSYDAAQTALGIVNPGGDVALKEAIRQNIGDLQLTSTQLDVLIQIFEYVSQNPGDYKNLLQQIIEAGALDEGDMPEEYDPEFIGSMLAVLQEMRQMQGAGAQEPMDMSPMVQGLQPVGMASGGLADVGQYLASKGRGGDSILAHITPEEAALLKSRGGSGTINPNTGLPEFKGGFLGQVFEGIGNVFKGVVNVVKDVLKSPVGRILGTIALATVLGPTAIGMSLGSAGTAAVASGAVTLAGGGSIKDALVSGAMGYFGGGGTIMGVNPVSSLGQYLPGVAGSALNTGLSTGLIGAGIGKLSGMSTEDALKMGLTSGVTAAGFQGLKNNTSMMNEPVTLDSNKQPVMLDSNKQPITLDSNNQPITIDANGQASSAAINPPGAIKAVGTAQDLLASRTPDGTMAPFDPNYDFYKEIGIDPRTMSSTSVGASPSNIQIERSMLGMTGPMDTARQFFQEPINVAKDIYSTNLSPSRAGLPADAGIIQKYGPLALAGTAAIAATGGMQGEPANQNPAFNRNYTGSDYMRDNPDKFTGGLSTYTKPTTLENPIVPTPSYTSIPVNQPSSVLPMGVTRSPTGVAQPYNVSGLYGVPLIYGPDGQLRRMAKGGDAKMTSFPRRQGPINGPGTGTSDDIPAMLSDGEFVFTAKAVRNAGGGSRRKGAARMYKMMKMLEGGAVKGK